LGPSTEVVCDLDRGGPLLLVVEELDVVVVEGANEADEDGPVAERDQDDLGHVLDQQALEVVVLPIAQAQHPHQHDVVDHE